MGTVAQILKALGQQVLTSPQGGDQV